MQLSIKCVNIIGRWKSGCSADGSALEWGSRGRWFNSSHSDQRRSKAQCGGCFFVQVIGTSGLLQIQIRRSACRTQSVGMPLVQLQSLGPSKTVVTVWRLFFVQVIGTSGKFKFATDLPDIVLICALQQNRQKKHTNLQTFTICRVNKMWYNTSRRGQLQGRFPLCRYCVPRCGLQFGRICPTKYNCTARISSVRCSFLMYSMA